jgi:hypothetical protein
MTDETNTITIQNNAEPAPAGQESDPLAVAWRRAVGLSQSQMVPAHFQNNPQDCFVVVQLALELGINPLTALQNVFMIGGRPAYTAKFALALANRAKVFAGPIRYKVHKAEKREDLEVTAYAPLWDGDTAEVTLSYRTAMAEGWTRNKKYSTIPEQMLRWRAVKWLIDLHCPEILLGFEFADAGPPVFSNQPAKVVDTESSGPSLQDALLQQSNRPAQQPVVITQGEEASPPPATSEESEQADDR